MTEFFQDIKIFSTIVHVVGVVLGMGSALVADALFSFYTRDKRLSKTEISTLDFLSKIVLVGLVVISLSGVAIFLSDTEKYMVSDKFLAKMSILVVLLVNGYFLNKFIWPHLMERRFFTLKQNSVRQYSFMGGAVSVISWLSVCILGTLDSITTSYAGVMGVYISVLIFSIVCALVFEKKEFH